jgi:GT2 family glycosyltransferase
MRSDQLTVPRKRQEASGGTGKAKARVAVGAERGSASRGAADAVAAAGRAGATARPCVRGKFIFLGNAKYWIKAVSYGGPESGMRGSPTSISHRVECDFEAIAQIGFNTLLVETAPPVWLLDAAVRSGLRVMVKLKWRSQGFFLDDRALTAEVEDRIRRGVGQCAGHPALLAYVLGDRVSPSIMRWHGARRVERFLERLHRVAKELDPNGLFTYLNLAATDQLRLPFLDFCCFSLRLYANSEDQSRIARLQNLVGERPLVVSAADGERNHAGVSDWARSSAAQLSALFSAGCAGAITTWRCQANSGLERDRTDARLDATSSMLDRSADLALLSKGLAEIPFPVDKNWPRVTVVVCSFNGAATIRDTLDGLEALVYPDYEIVVVDDGSTDATASIACEYDLRLISTANRGLSNARNTGWQQATGEIVAYIDDDAYPDAHWLHYLAHGFMSTDYVGVGGPNLAPPGDGPIADCVANAPGGPVHVLLTDTEAEHIPGCNMAFRREALAAIGGFDARFRAAGDDVDVCWRLQDRGWKIGFSSAAVVWHHRRNSIKMYWRQQQGYGRAEALLEGKWPQKYNALGHYSWSGRLYGKGLTEALWPKVQRVYRNSSHSGYRLAGMEQAAAFLASLPLMPEWFLLIAALSGIVLLGASWPPLLWATPLLLIAVALPLAQAGLSAAKAEFPTPRPHRGERLVLKLITAALHLIQPIARLKGRLQHGLTPWRSRQSGRPVWRLRYAHESSSTTRVSPDTWRECIAARARARNLIVRENPDPGGWDLELRGGSLGSARVLMVLSDEATGGQRLRVRCWSRPQHAYGIALCLLLIPAFLAAIQGAWVAAFLIGFASLAGGAAAALQSARVLAELQHILVTAKPSEETRAGTQPREMPRAIKDHGA